MKKEIDREWWDPWSWIILSHLFTSRQREQTFVAPQEQVIGIDHPWEGVWTGTSHIPLTKENFQIDHLYTTGSQVYS